MRLGGAIISYQQLNMSNTYMIGQRDFQLNKLQGAYHFWSSAELFNTWLGQHSKNTTYFYRPTIISQFQAHGKYLGCATGLFGFG